ncbi:TetR/AcrR family transcriptional regulator [Aquisalimonas sp.]|uniref:TetR/AcrR family transcriptional regulator n=1 Tax=unclassified Aquisalimonas TaxID=2644645 RepID=UPI0025BB1F48|nr:TetR/AcrR family transcriptional regulator [Aquisalimonas sp.]
MKSTQKQTRDTVRDAAFRLFGRHGYDGVSIDTIARAVGLSKGALYWHFDGKEALFRECLEVLESLFEEHIIAPMQTTAAPRDQLYSFFQGVAALAEDERITDGIAGYWQEPYNSAVNRVFREQLGRQEDRLRQLLQQCLAALARERGERSVADLETRSETLMTLMEAVLLPLRRRSPATRRAIIEELRETVLKAY